MLPNHPVFKDPPSPSPGTKLRFHPPFVGACGCAPFLGDAHSWVPIFFGVSFIPRAPVCNPNVWSPRHIDATQPSQVHRAPLYWGCYNGSSAWICPKAAMGWWCKRGGQFFRQCRSFCVSHPLSRYFLMYAHSEWCSLALLSLCGHHPRQRSLVKPAPPSRVTRVWKERPGRGGRRKELDDMSESRITIDNPDITPAS